MDALATSIKLSRAGLEGGEEADRLLPVRGPTGVGKTEASRQLAKTLGLELIRFDMSSTWSATRSRG